MIFPPKSCRAPLLPALSHRHKPTKRPPVNPQILSDAQPQNDLDYPTLAIPACRNIVDWPTLHKPANSSQICRGNMADTNTGSIKSGVARPHSLTCVGNMIAAATDLIVNLMKCAPTSGRGNMDRPMVGISAVKRLTDYHIERGIL